jgi:hypothetical protein
VGAIAAALDCGGEARIPEMERPSPGQVARMTTPEQLHVDDLVEVWADLAVQAQAALRGLLAAQGPARPATPEVQAAQRALAALTEALERTDGRSTGVRSRP